jgi:hypothetical protein
MNRIFLAGTEKKILLILLCFLVKSSTTAADLIKNGSWFIITSCWFYSNSRSLRQRIALNAYKINLAGTTLRLQSWEYHFKFNQVLP